MKHLALWAVLAIQTVIGVVPTACARAGEGVAFYSADTNHLWNRLYSSLLVRRESDEILLNDLLDPPLWSNSRYLLSGSSHSEALTLLKEFADNPRLVPQMTPLQRALMQRDLLAVFHWLADHDEPRFTPEQRKLAESLTRAIRLVALATNEIHKLPSNYTQAAGRPDAINAFDTNYPHRAFLPKDLLKDGGDWLALESQADELLAAPVHFKEFLGRSAFEVRFRHADGRAAGEKYLAALAAMPKPFILEKPDTRMDVLPHTDPPHGPWPNPDTPHFPAGSMWALVRRAVLVGAEGKPVTSPLVESVQIRIYRTLDAHIDRSQNFFEWEMRRRLLLGPGGLHVTEGKEQRYSHFFSKNVDWLELPKEQNRRVDDRNELNCFACHYGTGIHSVLSRSRLFKQQLARPPEFRAITGGRVAQITELEIAKLPGWQLLRWLWESQSP